MSTPTRVPALFDGSPANRRKLVIILASSALVMFPFLLWPPLARRLLATDFGNVKGIHE